jgi:hypothetical protein
VQLGEVHPLGCGGLDEDGCGDAAKEHSLKETADHDAAPGLGGFGFEDDFDNLGPASGRHQHEDQRNPTDDWYEQADDGREPIEGLYPAEIIIPISSKDLRACNTA